MIISLSKNTLAEAVGSVARFSERKMLALPALSAVAIRADEDGIHIRATNLETSIERSVEGTVRAKGAVAVPAGILREITSSLSGEGAVSLELSGETLVVSTERGKGTLKTLPYEDVPTIETPEGAKTSFSLPGASLKALVASVAPYASPSTVRPELASIFLSAEASVLQAVATDSFRLGEKKLSLAGSIPPFSLLIPAKNAVDIIQNLPDTDIEVRASEHQCAFLWEGGVAVSRLVAMSYPDYKQIIPKAFTAEATVLRKDFEGALRRTAIFSDSFQKVRLGIDAKGKKATLAARNADVGEASEEISASANGETIELSFNHRYLSAPLSLFAAESITLSSAGIGRPLVMKGVGDTSFLYLVMPMNQ